MIKLKNILLEILKENISKKIAPSFLPKEFIRVSDSIFDLINQYKQNPKNYIYVYQIEDILVIQNKIKHTFLMYWKPEPDFHSSVYSYTGDNDDLCDIDGWTWSIDTPATGGDVSAILGEQMLELVIKNWLNKTWFPPIIDYIK